MRRFGEWCAGQGVKGKFSACVGRLDRFLPGWSKRELDASLELVRTVMMPNWDIHPEMVTHTRVIDLRTGQPFPDASRKFMENWDWTTDRSVDEIAIASVSSRVEYASGLDSADPRCVVSIIGGQLTNYLLRFAQRRLAPGILVIRLMAIQHLWSFPSARVLSSLSTPGSGPDRP